MLLDGFTDVAIITPTTQQHRDDNMSTFTTLSNIRQQIADQYGDAGLDRWETKLHYGREYNKVSRAIEAYLGIETSTKHDFPETLQQLKQWFYDNKLGWFFNDAVEEYGIPVTPIEETTAA